MGTLPPTPNLGLVLPNPGTAQPFSTATQNGWFQTIDTAVGNIWGMANPATQRFRSSSSSDVSLASTTHPFQIGPTGGQNLRMDNNEIQSVDNGAASGLLLNGEGGDVTLGDDSSVVKLGSHLLSQIRPTQVDVSGGSGAIGSDGDVSLSDVTSARIRGAFPANGPIYELLLTIWAISGTATNIYAGFSSAGVTSSGVNSRFQAFGAGAIAAGAGGAGVQNAPITGDMSNLTGGFMRFVVATPRSTAERTKAFYDSVVDNNSGERHVGLLFHTAIEDTDGFRIGITGGGTLTAKISILERASA